jgi:serine/threonine protein kinase
VSLGAGTRLGPYEILAAIGSGGMGEVYKACDTKLDRAVAIKILPELFAADAERVARFEREAKTLAALNHPRICVADHAHSELESRGEEVTVAAQFGEEAGSTRQGSNRDLHASHDRSRWPAAAQDRTSGRSVRRVLCGQEITPSSHARPDRPRS